VSGKELQAQRERHPVEELAGERGGDAHPRRLLGRVNDSQIRLFGRLFDEATEEEIAERCHL